MLTIVTFLVGSAGLVMVSQDEIALVVMGAMLVVGSAILFARHFWRESDRKRKQEMSAYQRSLGAEIARVTEITEQSRADVQDAVGSVSHKVDVFTQGVLEYMAQLELDIKEQEESGTERNSQLQRRMADSHRATSRRIDTVVTQISAIMGLYRRLRPQAPYPPFGGWAIGGECAHLLVDLVLAKHPKTILEIGSGLSTVLMAEALNSLSGEGEIISLEQDKYWIDKAQAMIDEHGVGHRVQIVHAPLTDVQVGEETFRWYDVGEEDLPAAIDLLFIDGPPEGTGPMARYPALPVLFERISHGGTIVMDDASRDGEQAAIERWTREFPGLEIRYHRDSKGTVEITKP
jgi:predicted O-methyltransferase YrrM